MINMLVTVRIMCSFVSICTEKSRVCNQIWALSLITAEKLPLQPCPSGKLREPAGFLSVCSYIFCSQKAQGSVAPEGIRFWILSQGRQGKAWAELRSWLICAKQGKSRANWVIWACPGSLWDHWLWDHWHDVVSGQHGVGGNFWRDAEGSRRSEKAKLLLPLLLCCSTAPLGYPSPCCPHPGEKPCDCSCSPVATGQGVMASK